MPAVTVDNVLSLPRITDVDAVVDRARPVTGVTSAPSGFEGEGFPVRRAFAGVDLATLDPFIHMDQMGEVDYAPGEPKGTPWHPHRGFETVTYMIDGLMEHQDSNGGGGMITDGDTQWMTAGAGILHIEAPPEHVGDVGWALPRSPAVGESAELVEVRCPSLPRHHLGEGGSAHVARRWGVGAAHRRRSRRSLRSGRHVHANHLCCTPPSRRARR